MVVRLEFADGWTEAPLSRWSGGPIPAGVVAFAEQTIRATDMQWLRYARALLIPPGRITAHSIYIARQLGIPLAACQFPPSSESDRIRIQFQQGGPGHGVGVEACPAAGLGAIRHRLRELFDIRLNCLVGVSLESIGPVPHDERPTWETLFCTEHCYALSGVNPFHAELSQVTRILDTGLKPWAGSNCGLVVRTADIDPLEFRDSVAPDCRGLRRLLDHPAILEAEAEAAVRIGAPLCFTFVRSASEWMQARQIVRRVSPILELGCMIETPLLVEQLDQLEELSFAYLGLGDLSSLLIGAQRGGWVQPDEAECRGIQDYVRRLSDNLDVLGVRFKAPLSPVLEDRGVWQGPREVYVRDLGDVLTLSSGGKGGNLFLDRQRRPQYRGDWEQPN